MVLFHRLVSTRFMAFIPRRPTVLLSIAVIMLFGLTAVWLGAVGTTRFVDDATCPATGSGTSVNPYCHIQDAICTAVSGDTVSVAPGLYTEAVRMKPGVSVISQGGAAVTTINAANQPCTDTNHCAKRVGNQCSVVTFASGHTTSTRLEGFTVSGGAGLIQSNRVAGGGVYVFSSPTIVNNVITNNVLSGPLPQGGDVRGAGVYVATGSPIISNNTISGNRAVAPAGTSTTPTFGYGGGVWVGFASSPTVANNVIQGNVAGDPAVAESLGMGGGVVLYPNSGTISPVVDRNLVADNSADGTGGGISLNSLTGTLVEAVVTNNVVVGNTARFGGGVYTYFVKSRTVNNTITGNEAFLGGGLYSGQSDTTLPVTITNNVIEGNTLRDFGTGGGIYTLDLSATFDPFISTNDIWGNERNQCGGERTDGTCIGVQGNFSNDPRFVNRGARNYHLDPNSPAIDRGNAPGSPGNDFDGLPRGVDGNGVPNNPSPGDIDVGAFEFSGSCVPQPETCDSLDNNCNVLIDDGLGSTTCGVGACQATVQNCVSGQTQTCTPGTPVAEICDSLDNNCNGTPDDGLGSTTCGIGTCQMTVQNCVGGVVQSCTPGSPTGEICDGFDNDCNGVPDNGLGNTTCGVGACQVTVQNCVAGNSQTCTPGSAVAETCDGLDNNCNGIPDDGLGNTTCGVGACQVTVQNCAGGVAQTCTPGAAVAETCDGLDNNCNGTPDDGLGNTTCGVGACQVTVQNCAGGVAQTCTPGAAVAETCDGLDNNCNGTSDDGLGNTTCGIGACQVTVQNCAGGVAQTCTPGSAVAESCDGLDNNCNGTPDDGLGNTTCGVGACQATVQNCVGGVAQTCTPGAAVAETCDGLDNNCNGIADEGFPNQDGDALPDCLDPDDDNDSVLDASDCAPFDPGAFAWPSEISGVDLPVDAPTTIVYDQQAIGSGAHYEIISGLLGRLAAVAGFQEGFCLTSVSTGGSWIDARPAPIQGEGWYYLVRSANGCGLGTLGTPLRDAAGSGDVCQIGRADSDADGSPDDLDCSDNDPAISPNQPEVCDGLDNNCNLSIDENNPGGGLSCGSTVGTCMPGLTVCSAGALICNGAIGPAPETCDGLDNDCDGVADNNAPDFDLDGLNDCLDPDDDNDAIEDGSDCAPLDAGAFAPPSEVADLDMVDGAPFLLQWMGQSVGAATLYDLGSGSINVAAFDFATGACLLSTGATTMTDPRPAPQEGEGWYYLVKARNVCGQGTYGTAQRDALPVCP